jgi:hypothetical protein
MKENEKAAVVACLLEVLGEGNHKPASTGTRVWAASRHPHIDSWSWTPRSEDGYRLSGRLNLFRSRQTGRF